MTDLIGALDVLSARIRIALGMFFLFVLPRFVQTSSGLRLSDALLRFSTPTASLCSRLLVSAEKRAYSIISIWKPLSAVHLARTLRS